MYSWCRPTQVEHFAPAHDHRKSHSGTGRCAAPPAEIRGIAWHELGCPYQERGNLALAKEVQQRGADAETGLGEDGEELDDAQVEIEARVVLPAPRRAHDRVVPVVGLGAVSQSRTRRPKSTRATARWTAAERFTACLVAPATTGVSSAPSLRSGVRGWMSGTWHGNSPPFSSSHSGCPLRAAGGSIRAEHLLPAAGGGNQRRAVPGVVGDGGAAGLRPRNSLGVSP